MSLKDKIMNVLVAHPKLVTFGIGMAITFVVGTVIGMFDTHFSILAFASRDPPGNIIDISAQA